MVKIVNYHAVEDSNGETFYSLSIQGGVELVQSQETGNFYATARKTRITSTFDENTCIGLIGTELPGKIVKVDCEPFEYVVPDSGEVILLEHTYRYVPDEMESPEMAVLSE